MFDAAVTTSASRLRASSFVLTRAWRAARKWDVGRGTSGYPALFAIRLDRREPLFEIGEDAILGGFWFGLRLRLGGQLRFGLHHRRGHPERLVEGGHGGVEIEAGACNGFRRCSGFSGCSRFGCVRFEERRIEIERN